MFFVPGAFVPLSQGIALPCAQAGAMATVPRLAGTAAGIGVFVQQVLGAAFAQLYGLTPTGRRARLRTSGSKGQAGR